jgi:hypothetical protein
VIGFRGQKKLEKCYRCQKVAPVSGYTALILAAALIMTAYGNAEGGRGGVPFIPVWTAITPGTASGTTTTFGTSYIYGIACGGPAGQERFVAVGADGKMAYSNTR